MKYFIIILFLIGSAKAQFVNPGYNAWNNHSSGVVGKDSAKFNLSASAHSVSGWVNVVGDPSTGTRTATGGNSNTITFTSVQTSHWTTFSGVCAAADNGINSAGQFPAAVNFQSWFQGAATLSGSNYQVKIGGLNDSKFYKVQVNGIFPTATLTDYYYEGAVTSPTLFEFGSPTTSNTISAYAEARGSGGGGIQSSGGFIYLYFIPHSGYTFCMLGAVTIVEQ